MWTAEPAQREHSSPDGAPAGDPPTGPEPDNATTTDRPTVTATRRIRIDRPRPLGYTPDPAPQEIPTAPEPDRVPGASDPASGPARRAPLRISVTSTPPLPVEAAAAGPAAPARTPRHWPAMPVEPGPATGSANSGSGSLAAPPSRPPRPAVALVTLPVVVDRVLRDRIHAEALPYLPAVGDQVGLDQVREEATEVVARAVARHRRAQIDADEAPMDLATEQRVTDAVLDLVYGVGPLQELFDLGDDVEDVHICGWDNTVVSRNSGTPARVPPVVASDQELVDAVNALAARHGRQFSTAHPMPTFSVPELFARVTASMDVSLRPYVVIRRHSAAMRASTLEDLVASGTFEQPVADFLRAAVRAKLNILFGGAQNTGKTTTMRAAALECGLTEVIATLESDKELYLERLMPQLGFLHTVKTFTSREANSDGSGQVTLDDLTPHMLRMSLNRLLVGEVRGYEALAMLDAAQSNAGTMGTVHGRNPEDAMARFIGLVARAGLTEDRAQDMVRRNIDLLVYSRAVDNRPSGGRIERFVSHILEVTVGDGFAPHYNEVFTPGPDGRAAPKATPACLDELIAVGYESPSSWWGGA